MLLEKQVVRTYNYGSTDRTRRAMKAIPFLINRGELVEGHSGIMRDQVVLDDDLPAVLSRDVSGYILSRGTYVTEVKQETVDDN